MNKEEIIKKLSLKPLKDEGGFIDETYRGKIRNNREAYSSSTYLITKDSFSCMHRLPNDEIWYFHDGESVEMLLIYEDHFEVVVLGKDFEKGELPQIRVKGGVWQGAHMKYDGEYSLVSLSMTPAYSEKEIDYASFDELKDKTEYKDLLRKLIK